MKRTLPKRTRHLEGANTCAAHAQARDPNGASVPKWAADDGSGDGAALLLDVASGGGPRPITKLKRDECQDFFEPWIGARIAGRYWQPPAH